MPVLLSCSSKNLSTSLVIAVLVLAACQSSASPAPVQISETIEVAEKVGGTPVIRAIAATPESSAEPGGPRTLVVCLPDDPGSLYHYDDDQSVLSDTVRQAIYDGPIDSRGFDHQPVILEKLPSLADGDAQLGSVEVFPGDTVVDDEGNPVRLQAGVRVRPSGCQSQECAISYDGSSALQMDQLVVAFKLMLGLVWSDGAPLTAADSVYSFKLAVDPNTPGDGLGVKKSVIERTKSYTALDDLTIQWTGLPGYLDSTYFLNFWQPLPQHLWGHLSAADLLTAEESNQMPVGWGPYVIEEWVPRGQHHPGEKRELLPRRRRAAAL